MSEQPTLHFCRECGEIKPIEQFNKIMAAGPREPWNLRRCKLCAHREYASMMADAKAHRAQNEAARNWKKRNPEKHAEHAREYRKRHPEQTMAQNRLNYAVRMGRIKRQPCAVCGTTDRVHAHHHSYEPDHWYDVRWLCFECHKSEHHASDSPSAIELSK